MTGIPTVSIDGVPHPLPEACTSSTSARTSSGSTATSTARTHIPLRDLPGRLSDVPEGQTLVVCKVGGRSAQAVAYLHQQGHDVVNLDGGMLDWDGRRPADGERDRPADPTGRLTRLTGTAAGQREVDGAPAARRRYAARGTVTTPSDARWSVRHCTSSTRRSACSSRSRSTSADQRDLRGVGDPVEHRLAGEEPADRDAVQAADELAVPPGLDRVRPAQLVQPRVGRRGSARRSRRPSRAGSAQAAITSSKAVSTRTSIRRTRLPQRAGDPQPVERQHPALHRRPPQQRPRDRRRPPASGTARGGRPPAACPAPGRRPSRPGRRRAPSGRQGGDVGEHPARGGRLGGHEPIQSGHRSVSRPAR